MRSANMSESADIPEAKPASVSVLPDLEVRIHRSHSSRAGTHILHRLSAEHEKPNSELLKHWQGEQGVKVGGHKHSRADWANPLKDSCVLCSFWNSHLELAAKTCQSHFV